MPVLVEVELEVAAELGVPEAVLESVDADECVPVVEELGVDVGVCVGAVELEADSEAVGEPVLDDVPVLEELGVEVRVSDALLVPVAELEGVLLEEGVESGVPGGVALALAVMEAEAEPVLDTVGGAETEALGEGRV